MSPLSQHASDQLAALLNGFGLAAKTPLSNWIDGDLVAGEGEEITLINPATGRRWSVTAMRVRRSSSAPRKPRSGASASGWR